MSDQDALIQEMCEALRACNTILQEDAESLFQQGRRAAAEINDEQIRWSCDLIARAEGSSK